VEEARERSQKRPRKIGERSLKKKKKKGAGVGGEREEKSEGRKNQFLNSFIPYQSLH
jgi:hypothetical protein